MAAADTDPRTRPTGSGRLTGVRWLGCSHRSSRQPAGQPSQAAVAGPLGMRAAGVAGDLLGLGHGLAGDGGDLGGEPVDLGGRLPGAPPQGSGDLPEAAPGRARAVREPRAGRGAALADAADQPAEGAHSVLGQVGVGGVAISASMNRSSRAGRRPWRVRRGGVWPAEAAARPRRVAAERPRKAPQAPWALGRSSSSFCHDATALQEHLPCPEAIPPLTSSWGSG
jgi:hypothetical protein